MKRTNLILIFLLCILITNKCYSQSEFAEFTKKFLNLLEKDYKKNPEKYNNLLSNTIDLIQNSNQSNNSPTLKTPEESVEYDFKNYGIDYIIKYAEKSYDSENYYDAYVYYKKVAELGYPIGINGVGRCLSVGSPVKDKETAFKYFKLAADMGFARAQYNVGTCYEEKGNIETALNYYELSANQGFSWAQYRLAYLYDKENGFKTEGEKTSIIFNNYKLAADQGYVYALYRVGLCYLDGKGVKKNSSKAIEYLFAACRKDHAEAQKTVGDCYRFGIGVAKDIDTARRCYYVAISNGSKTAEKALEELRKENKKGFFSWW